jgi:hypothetical protein
VATEPVWIFLGRGGEERRGERRGEKIGTSAIKEAFSSSFGA